MPKRGMSCKTRSIQKITSVGALVELYLKIQWVVHTLEWEPKTLAGILWARQNVSEREIGWDKSQQVYIDPYSSQNFGFSRVVANQLGIPGSVVDSYPKVDMLLEARPNISLH